MLKPHVKENEKVLIPCSSLAKSDIADELSNVGANVDRVFIYDTVKGRVRNKRAFDEVDIVFFTSPSTVYNMIDMVGLDAIKEKQVIAIGTRTNKPLEELGIKAYICKEHSQDGFLKEIESFVKDMEA